MKTITWDKYYHDWINGRIAAIEREQLDSSIQEENSKILIEDLRRHGDPTRENYKKYARDIFPIPLCANCAETLLDADLIALAYNRTYICLSCVKEAYKLTNENNPSANTP